MNIVAILLVFALLNFVSSQSCVRTQKLSLAEKVVQSPIIVQVRIQINSSEEKIYNATAHVQRTFPTHNGSLTEESVFQFGPLGKKKSCSNIKDVNANYILFLTNPVGDNFYWIKFNPIKASQRTLRSLRKLLCSNCLVPPSFKKNIRVFKKYEGMRLKIKCRASGKPLPKMSWYHNGKLLSKSSTLKDIIINERKKGGSSTLKIEKLTRDYHETEFICSASNPVSQVAENFTAVVIISKFLGGAPCPKSCNAADADYCVEGMCCRDNYNRYCQCYRGWVGYRCETKDFTKDYFTQPASYRHMQRLVAVLGMCLALMLVVFVCFAVYCFFKSSRKSMHKKLLSHHQQTSQNSSRSVLTSNANQIVTDGIVETNPVKKLSRNSINGESRRSRLGGMAHNGIHFSSAKRLASSQNNSPSLLQALPKSNGGSNSVAILSGSESLTHMQRETSEIPLASEEFNSVNHLSGDSSIASSPKSSMIQIVNNQSKTEGRKLVAMKSMAGNSHNHIVTTFNSNENVQEDALDRGDGLVIETSHDSLPSPEFLHTADTSCSSVENSSPPVQYQNNESCNTNNNNCRDRQKVEVTSCFHANTSDQEDLFCGVDIPDMSLSLYSGTPDHSLKKAKLFHQNAVNTDVVCSSHSPTNFSSAEHYKLQLLSGFDGSGSDDATSQLSDYENNSESDSHKILV